MFSRDGGALFWMSPCIAFSIVVGLGLDYDVFFTESVIEAYDKGASAKEAVIDFLTARVAKWWLPDDVVFVDELPHGATGKVSKLTLRAQFKDYVLPTA